MIITVLVARPPEAKEKGWRGINLWRCWQNTTAAEGLSNSFNKIEVQIAKMILEERFNLTLRQVLMSEARL